MHGLQNVRLPCPSKSSGACSNSCQLSQWCHPTVSSYVILFSSCLLSILASGSFPISWLFISCGQSIGASDLASVLPKDIQDWFPLELTGLISLKSKGLSKEFPNTTVKLWYIYTMKYYSAVKKNSFESVLMRWMKLEPIIQNEVSQKDKEHYSILTHIYRI